MPCHFKKGLLLSILIISVISGCSNREQIKDENSLTVTTVPIETRKEIEFLNGTHFPNTNDFIVNNFILSYNKFDNSLIIALTYKFGDIPKRFILEGKHSYYFQVSVPLELEKYFESPISKSAKGEELVSDENAKYQINIKIPFKKGLSDKIIEAVVEKPQRYSLIIYEDPDYPAKKIINVYEGLDLINQ